MQGSKIFQKKCMFVFAIRCGFRVILENLPLGKTKAFSGLASGQPKVKKKKKKKKNLQCMNFLTFRSSRDVPGLWSWHAFSTTESSNLTISSSKHLVHAEQQNIHFAPFMIYTILPRNLN